MDSSNRPKSLRELMLVSGVTKGRTRSAVEGGIIDPWDLTWADALVLRSFIPAQSLVLSDEAAPRNMTRRPTARSDAAVRIVRDAVAGDALEEASVLVVGRRTASVHASVEDAVALRAQLYADGALLVLPIGQWWVEDLRSRTGAF